MDQNHYLSRDVVMAQQNQGYDWQQVDDRFWNAFYKGIAALQCANAWLARRSLQTAVDEVALPLFARYFNVPDDQSATHPQLTDLLRRWGIGISAQHFNFPEIAPAIISAFQNLLADYEMVRRELGVSPIRPPAREQQIKDALASPDHLLRHDFARVKSWRTISVVLPAFNEESVIGETVDNCLDAVQRYCPNAEIIVVDDGSTDRTGAIIEGLMTRDVRVIAVHNHPNRGYGGALLAGFAAVRGEMTFFMDSDGQFDINDIARFLPVAEEQRDAAILGYRAKRSDPVLRKLNAWGWKVVTRAVIDLQGVRDIDCAFKLFPTRVMQACELRSNGATINAELLRKFQKMQVPLIQLPVQHKPRTKGSPTGAKPGVILRALRDIVTLRKDLPAWQEQVIGDTLHRIPKLGGNAINWRPILTLLVAALLIRLPFAPFRGFYNDLWEYIFWGFSLHTNTLNQYYVISHANYPPLTPYIYSVVARLYQIFSHFNIGGLFPPVISPTFHGDPTITQPYTMLSFMGKIPILFGDLLSVYVIYDLARRVLSQRWAMVMASLYAFSPAVLWDGVIWGQTDSLGMLFVLLAVRMLIVERYLSVGIMLGLAVMIKPQPVIFIPLFLFYLWRWQGWKPLFYALGGIAATTFIIFAPFLNPAHPAIRDFIHNENAVVRNNHATVDAFNLWYIIGRQHIYDSPFLGPLTPNTIGYLLFGILLLVVLWGTFHDRSLATLVMGLSLLAVAFFDVTTLQHERYLFPAVVLLLLVMVYKRTNPSAFILASVLTLLNMAFASLRTYIGFDQSFFRSIYSFTMLQHPEIPLVMSYVAMALLAVLVYQYVEHIRTFLKQKDVPETKGTELRQEPQMASLLTEPLAQNQGQEATL
jgi:Gpi18-like mannosyltransferase